jgi:hypothetical protein
MVVPDGIGTDAIDHDDVPVATPLPPRLVDQLTWVTPTLSLAVPPTASVEAFAAHVAELVGVVIVTVGAVVSGGAGTVKATPALQVPSPAAFAVRIHHVAAPGARATAGLIEHVVSEPQPTADAEYVVSILACWLASFTQSW